VLGEKNQTELGNNACVDVFVKHQPISFESIGLTPKAYIVSKIFVFLFSVGIAILVLAYMNAGVGVAGGIAGILLLHLAFVIRGIVKALKGKNTDDRQTCITINNLSDYKNKLENWLSDNNFEQVDTTEGIYRYTHDKTLNMCLEYEKVDNGLVLMVSLRDGMYGKLFDIGPGVLGALIRPKARKMINGLLQHLNLETQSF
jgi:hypothetical protein